MSSLLLCPQEEITALVNAGGPLEDPGVGPVSAGDIIELLGPMDMSEDVIEMFLKSVVAPAVMNEVLVLPSWFYSDVISPAHMGDPNGRPAAIFDLNGKRLCLLTVHEDHHWCFVFVANPDCCTRLGAVGGDKRRCCMVLYDSHLSKCNRNADTILDRIQAWFVNRYNADRQAVPAAPPGDIFRARYCREYFPL